MYIGFSKTLARFGGFRLGAGLRMTKNNFIWMCFIVLTIQMFKATWHMMICSGWLCYAMFYGIIWIFRKTYQPIVLFYKYLFKKIADCIKKRGNQA